MTQEEKVRFAECFDRLELDLNNLDHKAFLGFVLVFFSTKFVQDFAHSLYSALVKGKKEPPQ